VWLTLAEIQTQNESEMRPRAKANSCHIRAQKGGHFSDDLAEIQTQNESEMQPSARAGMLALY
jgi:hypothetical protein